MKDLTQIPITEILRKAISGIDIRLLVGEQETAVQQIEFVKKEMKNVLDALSHETEEEIAAALQELPRRSKAAIRRDKTAERESRDLAYEKRIDEGLERTQKMVDELKRMK